MISRADRCARAVRINSFVIGLSPEIPAIYLFPILVWTFPLGGVKAAAVVAVALVSAEVEVRKKGGKRSAMSLIILKYNYPQVQNYSYIYPRERKALLKNN